MESKFVLTWRKTGEELLDWGLDFFADECDLKRALANLKAQGVHQYATYRLAGRVPELSSEY